MPTGEVYNQLNDLISELSRRYSTPYFEPHVTLLGDNLLIFPEEEMLSKTEELATLIDPFTFRLNEIGQIDSYYRALFLRGEKTPELTHVNTETRKIFGLPEDPDFMPHLSLLYGDLPVETKQKIIREIGNVDYTFDVGTIHLYSTDGELEDWYKVKEFSL